MEQPLSQNPISEWPKTEFGTVDWEVVFEDPNGGLIPTVQATFSPLDLKQTTTHIVQQLFPRGADRGENSRFLAELDLLIPDDIALGNLPILQEAVIGILRGVKDKRIERAQAYERAQRGAPADNEADTPTVDDSRINDLRAADRRTVDRRELVQQEAEVNSFTGRLRTKKFYIPLAGGAFAASLALFVFLGADADYGTKPVAAMPAPSLALFVSQMQKAANDRTTAAHAYGGILHVSQATGSTTVTASEVPNAICTSGSRELVRLGVVLINGQYSKKMEMDVIERLCALSGDKARLTWRPRAVVSQ